MSRTPEQIAAKAEKALQQMYAAALKTEAQLKPVGEAAVKRLREEHGMSRPNRVVRKAEPATWFVFEGCALVNIAYSEAEAKEIAEGRTEDV